MAKYKAEIIITDQKGETVIAKAIKPVQLVYDACRDIYTFYVTNATYRISGDIWRDMNVTKSDGEI